jgi:hypothetical protein
MRGDRKIEKPLSKRESGLEDLGNPQPTPIEKDTQIRRSAARKLCLSLCGECFGRIY